MEMAGKSPLPSNIPVHHRLPQEYRGLFPGKEVDQLDNWVGVPANIHYQINAEWRNFKRAYPNPTADDVRTFAMWIDANYGRHFIRP